MQQHLQSCERCRQTASSLAAVAETAAVDRAAPVPPELTVRARALFQPHDRPRDWVEALRELAAQLVFDSSALEGLPAGVRGPVAEPSRLLTFQAGDYEVDLRLESGGEAPEIVGQIARRGGSDAGLEGALVQMITGGKTVSETETNRFGEFVLGRPVRSAGVLRIAIQRHGCRFDLPIHTKKAQRK